MTFEAIITTEANRIAPRLLAIQAAIERLELSQKQLAALSDNVRKF